MTAADTLISLAALWCVAVLTPGPNMLFFTSVALSSSRRALAAAGAGIVLGTAVWGVAGLFGLLWLFETFPVLAFAIKVLGGLYLAWIGAKILWGSLKRRDRDRPSLAAAPPVGPRKAFMMALATNLANPKSLVFVTSLFAVTRLAEAPLAVGLAGVGVMILISSFYYVLCGWLLRAAPAARRDGFMSRAIGVAVGAAMMAFGARMAWDR
jgi:threonine/homoserine/homoserine lactone efflux protein